MPFDLHPFQLTQNSPKGLTCVPTWCISKIPSVCLVIGLVPNLSKNWLFFAGSIQVCTSQMGKTVILFRLLNLFGLLVIK